MSTTRLKVPFEVGLNSTDTGVLGYLSDAAKSDLRSLLNSDTNTYWPISEPDEINLDAEEYPTEIGAGIFFPVIFEASDYDDVSKHSLDPNGNVIVNESGRGEIHVSVTSMLPDSASKFDVLMRINGVSKKISASKASDFVGHGETVNLFWAGPLDANDIISLNVIFYQNMNGIKPYIPGKVTTSLTIKIS